MENFICPICRSDLKRCETSLKCAAGHSFDVASQGYVNLLPSSKARSSSPGDDRSMVESRTRLLSSGAYLPFAKALCDICKGFDLPQSPCVLDAGCGQGYYAGMVKDCLENSSVYGVDLSKPAVKYAAGHCKGAYFAVAGVYDMPFRSGAADIVLSIFSPIAAGEFARVTRRGGHLVIAVPGPDHLWGMKEILYENPYKNKEISTSYDGFEFVGRVRVPVTLSLEGGLIYDLFTMTPYYWKTGAQGQKRLRATSRLVTPAQFDYLIYKRV